MPNRFSPISQDTPFESALAAINNNFRELDSEVVTKVFKSAGNINALIEGRLPNNLGYGLLFTRPNNTVAIAIYIDENGNPVLKVSKDGEDAVTGNDDELIFNSQQNVYKVLDSDSITNTVVGTLASGATQTESKAHGLTYTPRINGFINGTGSTHLTAGEYYQTPHMVPINTGTYEPGLIYRMRVDATNVYADIVNYSSVGIGSIGTTIFDYDLLQESISS